ncbi:hypothetical protein NIES80_34960 [Dolichospermum planctonicum]|uniref:Uncharacterized protein n=1 Tax=Dolichospermum planctonicum TaxID=136072 RepID=A0A480AFH9_9CYAN|nr:hypothetical protein NIES80_34960 [Dolichospermum planctonicum]
MATSEELVQWSVVSGQWSVVSGQWSVIKRESPITYYLLPISSTVKYPRRRYRLDSTLL